MDNATATCEKLAFARCFVEISSKTILPNSVKMDLGNGELIETPVQYEWVPPKCAKCLNFGHSEHQCPVVNVEIWVPKEVGTSKENNAKGKDKVLDDSVSLNNLDDLVITTDTHIASGSGSANQDTDNDDHGAVPINTAAANGLHEYTSTISDVIGKYDGGRG